MIIFKKEFPSAKETSQEIIHSIINEIENPPNKLLMTYDELRLVLDEAINNAMEHGNRWDPGKKVTVNIKKSSDCFHVTISDEGDGFQIPMESHIPETSHLNERGRGIRIIRYFCTAEWHNNGSAINLLFPVECTH